jgi:hypothetical protein
MDGDLVFQSDNPQDSSSKLLNSTPESPPIAFLPLHSDGILQKPEGTIPSENRAFGAELHSQNTGCTGIGPYKKYTPFITEKLGDFEQVFRLALYAEHPDRRASRLSFGINEAHPIAEGGMRFTFPPYGPFRPLYSRTL